MAKDFGCIEVMEGVVEEGLTMEAVVVEGKPMSLVLLGVAPVEEEALLPLELLPLPLFLGLEGELAHILPSSDMSSFWVMLGWVDLVRLMFSLTNLL